MKTLIIILCFLSFGLAQAAQYYDKEQKNALFVSKNEQGLVEFKYCVGVEYDVCETLGREGGYEPHEVWELSNRMKNLKGPAIVLSPTLNAIYYIGMFTIAGRVVSVMRGGTLASAYVTRATRGGLKVRLINGLKIGAAKAREVVIDLGLTVGVFMVMRESLDQLLSRTTSEFEDVMDLVQLKTNFEYYKRMSMAVNPQATGYLPFNSTRVENLTVTELAEEVNSLLWSSEECPHWQTDVCDELKSLSKARYEESLK